MRTPRIPARPLASAAVALLATLSLLAIVSPFAAAQAPSSSGTLTAQSIEATANILAPGESAGLKIQAMRACTHPGQVLPAGSLQVHAVTQSGLIAITGPTSIAMDQLVCAQMPRQHIEILLDATARSDLESLGNFSSADETVVFQLHTDASMVGSQPPQDAVISTHFLVKAPKEASVDVALGAEQVAPGGSLVALLGVLGVVAGALRRRLA